MKNVHRNSWKSGISSLSKATSHDSCLDHIDEALICTSSETRRKKQCYSVPSGEYSKRRATIVTSSPGSSLLEISKSGSSGSNKFMSFLHKGFHGHKSKNSLKLEKEKSRNSSGNITYDSMQDIIPIPIRETALQGHTRTLFHKVPNSNLRAKSLIILTDDTKISPIHASILSAKFSYCVKILSTSPKLYRESADHKYELTLPTGTRSLGKTCRIINDEESQERCQSCHSSQLSLFSAEQSKKPMIGYVFSCASAFEQKKWTTVLTRIAKPNQQNERRKEISLNIWIQEAKNVPCKKRYFCEIYLDGSLYARTTTKMMGDMLFWGEEFNLCNLDDVNVVTLLLWKCADESRSKKKKSQQQLICQINIPTVDINQRTSVEKWYSSSTNYSLSSPESPPINVNQCILSSANTACVPISQSAFIPSIYTPPMIGISIDNVPTLRIKARYQHLDVLPLSSYADLIKFLNDNAVKTLIEIEPFLKVKAKEDLAQNLIKIIYKRGTAVSILCDLIVNEINKSDDKNLILRGNTMASKAMEIYLKLVGEKYLQVTLSDFINRVLLGQDDCEVDPQKERSDVYGSSTLGGMSAADKTMPQYCLIERQESLLMNVEMIWAKIMSSSIYFPKDLKVVFVALRQRLHGSSQCTGADDQPDLCDRIISACIFLRYICPAILTPSLFGLIPEYPDNPKVTRTLTLVAKCIQTLANFTSLCGTKETYMVFMNHFIESNFKAMRSFLREISVNNDVDNGRKEKKTDLPPQTSTEGRDYLYWDNLSSNLPEENIDLSLCLATLHRQMEDCLQLIGPQNFSKNLESLQCILGDIDTKLKSESEIPSHIKSSNSYQNIKLPALPTQEYTKLATFEASDSITKKNKNSKTEFKTVPDNNKLRPKKSSLPRPTSNSHSAESTPTHQSLHKSKATTEYLMTQSMMEKSSSNCSTPINVQVDKEWKAMLSASYAYTKTEEMFFGEDTTVNQEIKSSNSSGYQTLSRSIESIVGGTEEMIITPKSPTLSLKPSVKKCKQSRRQAEVISRPDSLNSQTHICMAKRHKECTHKPGSSADSQSFSTKHNCYLHEEDSSSTQTLTGINVFKCEAVQQSEQRPKIINSVSMPAFHSNFDCETKQPHESYIFLQTLNIGEVNPNTKLKQPTSDESPTYSNGKSAFRETTKLKQVPLTSKTFVNTVNTANVTDDIKYSLHLLRNTLNSRMKQLLLADRTTIHLELERVKLMKRICGRFGSAESISTNNVILFNERDSNIRRNGSILVFDYFSPKPISVKRYLDIAERILEDVYNSFIKTDKNKTIILEKEMEDLLVQIFQTNQYLQNTLMTKNDRTNTSDTLLKPQLDHADSNSKKVQSISGTNRPPSNKPSADHMKSNSLGSLVTKSCSSGLIEIVDAV